MFKTSYFVFTFPREAVWQSGALWCWPSSPGTGWRKACHTPFLYRKGSWDAKSGPSLPSGHSQPWRWCTEPVAHKRWSWILVICSKSMRRLNKGSCNSVEFLKPVTETIHDFFLFLIEVTLFIGVQHYKSASVCTYSVLTTSCLVSVPCHTFDPLFPFHPPPTSFPSDTHPSVVYIYQFVFVLFF